MMRGRQLLKGACENWGLPYVQCGKLIIARERLCFSGPDGGSSSGRWQMGCPVCVGSRAAPSRTWSLDVRGVAALHSPQTAIVDFGRVARHLMEDCKQRGGETNLGTEATGFVPDGSGVQVITGQGNVYADCVVLCAGLQSDRLARLAGDVADPAIVPFRGEYYRLVPAR